jgi:nucleotidyltransferase/DNA polymerase involved in DNA repair
MITHIFLRVPGFYAQIEKSTSGVDNNRPLIVVVGEGYRSLVVSVNRDASLLGIHPGMRLRDISADNLNVITSNPIKYKSFQKKLCNLLSDEFDDVHVARPGLFCMKWIGGVRFIDVALNRAKSIVEQNRLNGSWGIASEMATAEIAAIRAGRNNLLWVKSGEEPGFLAPLSLNILYDLTLEQVHTLSEIGINTFGELAAIPKTAARSLFGPEGVYLRDIALTGRRRVVRNEWRDQRQLKEDSVDRNFVKKSISDMISLAHADITGSGLYPGRIRITLLYTDKKRVGGASKHLNNNHEGQWQSEAHLLVKRLWQRRVRISSVRMSIPYGSPISNQLNLFLPQKYQNREDNLNVAVSKVRSKWGISTVQYGTAV